MNSNPTSRSRSSDGLRGSDLSRSIPEIVRVIRESSGVEKKCEPRASQRAPSAANLQHVYRVVHRKIGTRKSDNYWAEVRYVTERSSPSLRKGCRMEPWGFEPQIQPCHGRVIPFHYGPRIVQMTLFIGSTLSSR